MSDISPPMAFQCQEGKQLKDKLKISVLDRAQNVLIVQKERWIQHLWIMTGRRISWSSSLVVFFHCQ